MFDDLKPDRIPAPPPQALPEAVRRGTTIRRRRRAAWATGVAAAVVLGMAVVLGNPFGAADTAQVVPATSTAVPKDYSVIPADRTYAGAKGLVFGFLQDATENTDGTLTLRIQPGYFYLGDEAKEQNGGEVPIGDALYGPKEGTGPSDFTLDPRAPLRGASQLLSGMDAPDAEVNTDAGEPIEAGRLTTYFTQDDATEVGIWFRLADDGTITALSEQYIS